MHLKFKNLLEISAKLRGEGGCPWDREQTIESLKPCLLDEAREVAEAIEKNDMDNLEEEIGDLLFCLIMIADVAKEEGKFDIGGVMDRIAEKMISRHTWVFGGEKADTAEEAVELWLKNKVEEKSKKRKQ